MSEAQVVFGDATEEQRLYIESLEERVAEYESDAFERLVKLNALKERVRERLLTSGSWSEEDVNDLLDP